MGRVIRAQRTGRAVVPAAVYDAQLEAAEVRERAQAEAQGIRQRAYTEGYAAGSAAAAEQLFDLARMQTELSERLTQEATQAALMVAGQLLGSELSSEPDKIIALLRPHLARMRRAHRLALRLHPDDAAWLEQHPEAVAELREQHTLAGSLELRRDPSIARGGCIVESNIGELDARIETRLSLLAAALKLPVADANPRTKDEDA
jgi:flagellar assembly protein FliH